MNVRIGSNHMHLDSYLCYTFQVAEREMCSTSATETSSQINIIHI